jgi:anti-sigma-K factor RskA
MEHSELKNLIPAYCLGALDEADKTMLEDHLKKGCPGCQIALAEMSGVAAHLAATVEEKAPPVYLKNRILAQIQSEESPSVVRVIEEDLEAAAVPALEKSRRLWRAVSGALALAAVILIFLFNRQIAQLKNDLAALQTQAQIKEQLVNDLQLRLLEKERILNVMQSPQIRLVELRGRELAPAAEGRVFWSTSENKAVFIARNLPAPAADKDYQLWIIRGGQPVDAGVFAIDEEGTGVTTFEIGVGPAVNAFAVTLEKKGGVPAPEGSMYLLGTI